MLYLHDSTAFLRFWLCIIFIHLNNCLVQLVFFQSIEYLLAFPNIFLLFGAMFLWNYNSIRRNINWLSHNTIVFKSRVGNTKFWLLFASIIPKYTQSWVILSSIIMSFTKNFLSLALTEENVAWSTFSKTRRSPKKIYYLQLASKKIILGQETQKLVGTNFWN